MYCRKCGKEARGGDVYCSGCGCKLTDGSKPTKGNSWILVLICVIALAIAAGKLFGGASVGTEESESVQTQKISIPSNVQESSVDVLPAEPKDGDILEESDYSNGMPRRRISDYSDVYITDYRPDGTRLRDTILYYYNGDTYGGKRVTNCDSHGNPTDETEIMSDGTLWLQMVYSNSYDEQGRPLVLAQYNRKGCPLYLYEYTYNADGSYSMAYTEYRGPVYEYDFAENHDGTTTIWFQSTTTFTPEGDLVDQLITLSDGVPMQ